MNIYILKPSFGQYRTLGPTNWRKPGVFEQINNGFDGKPFGKSWVPIEVDESDEKRLTVGDYAAFNHNVAILSQRAVDTIRDTLEKNGEILPLIYKKGNYYAYNITTVVDVLDKERSKFGYIPGTGRILRIEHYVFTPKKLKGLTIFKLPNLRNSEIYVTDTFVQEVEKAKLTGFNFQKVWELS